MAKKIQLLSLCNLLFFVAGNICFADEGMWLLPDIEKNKAHMTNLQIPVNKIYHPEQPSITDAIVIFGGFCTGEIISEKGLILTNHHCGYNEIQKRSTLENNILEKGFWAQSYEEEIPNPGLFVSFLIHFEDVTDSIIPALSDSMNSEEKKQLILDISDRLTDQAIDDSLEYYNAEVKSFYDDNQYFLLIYETYNDVRLVGTPPESVGKFGGDTDNWMWPRHTGDFSLFRIYADSSGNPADYHEDNIPLVPKYSLPVSAKEIQKNDFAMILGYPGSTSRYITTSGLDLLMEVEHPNRIEVRTVKQDIIKKAMEENPEIKLKYTSKYASSSNYWKYSIGQSRSIRQHNIREEKETIEKTYIEWAKRQGDSSQIYLDALKKINDTKKIKASYFNTLQYIFETMHIGSEIIAFASNAIPLYNALKNNNPDKEETENHVAVLQKQASRHWPYYDAGLDQKVTEAMLKIYFENIEKENHPDIYTSIAKRYKNDFSRFTSRLFARSIFADSASLSDFLENPKYRKLKRDPALTTAISFNENFLQTKQINDSLNNVIRENRTVFMHGLMAMFPDSNFYPEANFTMRFTYGSVQDYSPADAVHYDYITSSQGLLEKYDETNNEFFIPEELLTLIENKKFGEYANAQGLLPVNFITNNDITGGNSGSPVLNAKGHLIGLAFDGNWESMSGDISYMIEKQRCIAVDIRYILFIVEQYAGTTRIIDEIRIIH